MKPTTIYRPLLADAWRVTWERKSLWVFGIFAAIISSGGVVDVAISGLRQTTTSGRMLEHLLERSFIGYAYVSQFLLHLQKIDTSQFTLMLIAITLVCVGLVCAGVISQAALVHGTGEENKHPHLLRRHVLKHFWDVFLIDALTKALTILLIALTTLPVFLYLAASSAFAENVLFFHFLIFIPAIIILHILSMLSLICVVEENEHALTATRRALVLFKTHWLSTFEYGLILFAIVFGAGLLFTALLALLWIPYTLLSLVALASGSPIFFFLVNILSFFLFAALLLTFGGIVVTFQYGAWRAFYKRAAHRAFGLKPFSKIWRALFA